MINWNDPDEVSEYDKKRYRENDRRREQCKKRAKRWAENNPDKRKEIKRNYNNNNRIEVNIYNNNWNKNNPDRVRISRKKCKLKKYNLTLEEYSKLVESQDNKCGICNKVFTNNIQACVDHDHTTNIVRGILCRNCNYGLGLLGDNLESAINVVNYLKSRLV